MVSYNLGFSAARPALGEFNYGQKIEYLAFLWGIIVMALNGLTLWFNTLALRYFPKWVLDAATALHYYEAILATFAILIWHMYSVVFDPDVYPLDRARVVVPPQRSSASQEHSSGRLAGSPTPEPVVSDPRETDGVHRIRRQTGFRPRQHMLTASRRTSRKCIDQISVMLLISGHLTRFFVRHVYRSK